MKKMLNKVAALVLVAAATVLFQTAAFASPSFTLDPVGGGLAGSPGETVGWGFTLTNDASYYLIVSSVDFQSTQNLVGAFTEFMASVNGIMLDPMSSLTQAFDLAAQTGVGGFAIDGDAAAPSMTTGRILLTYDLYDENFNTISAGNILTPNASVNVVPIPGAMWLLGSALAGLLRLKKRLG